MKNRNGPLATDNQTQDLRNVCSYCPTDFHCENLELALKVLRSKLKERKNPYVERELERLVQEIEKEGWSYPFSEKRCSLDHNSKRVIQITEELIGLIEQAESIAS